MHTAAAAAAATAVAFSLILPGLAAAQATGPASPEQEWQRLRGEGRRAFEQGHFEEAEAPLSAALRLAQQLPPGEPLLESLRDLATLDRATGRLKEAGELLRAVLVTREAQVGKDSADLVGDIDALGWVSLSALELEAALDYFRRSRALVETRYGLRDLALIPALLNLARVTSLLKQDHETVILLSRVIDIRQEARGRDHPEVAGDLVRLARHHAAQHRDVEAETLFLQSLRILEKANGALSFSLTGPLEELSAVYVSAKRFPDAEVLLRRSLAIRELTGGPINPDNAGAWESLGSVLDDLKRPAESELAFRRALDLWKLKLGPEHPLIAATLDRIGLACAAQQKIAEAEGLFRAALAIRRKETVANLNNLGLMLGAQRKFADAEPFFSAALSLLDKPGPAAGPPLDDATRGLLKATLDNYADVLDHRHQTGAAARLRARAKAIGADRTSADRR